MIELLGDTKDYVVNLRRKLHSNPELGLEEIETQKLIIRELEKLNLEYKKIKTGTIVDIGDKKSKDIIAFRADIDALKILEKNQLPYSSKNIGKMHACGHDSHTAILLGLARELVKNKNHNINGRVRLIFQPNEEGEGGAKELIKNGVLDGVKAIFALHVKTDLPVYSVGLKANEIMASVDEMKIKLIGSGGHGAIPQKSIDIILISSQIVLALNTIVSRNINPNKSAVLSICKIASGTSYNIIPNELEIEGTIRTFDNDTRNIICENIKKILENFSKIYGIKYELDVKNTNGALINDKAMTENIIKIFREKNIFEKITILEEPSMGGDDFAEYLKYVKGVYFYLGAGNKDKNCNYDWHSPYFNIDEDAVDGGVKSLLAIAGNIDKFL